MADIQFEKLGTLWHIRTDVPIKKTAIIKSLDEFENKYSRFKNNSLISRFNRGEKVIFPSDFLQTLKLASKIKEETEGIFDISAGKILESWGYDNVYSFDETSDTIHDTTYIDTGSFGKGMVIDQIALKLVSLGVKDMIINAGGDIWVSSNKVSTNLKLENPLDVKQYIGQVKINNAALAGSSSNRRRWRTKDSMIRHHLVDMRKKENVQDKAGVFILAENALLADILATAVFVSPYSIWQNLIYKYKVGYCIVFPDGKYEASKEFVFNN